MQIVRRKINSGIKRAKLFWHTRVRKLSIKHPPTFIVGCGHSGTSVLLASLGAHSKIHAIPTETGIATTGNRPWFQKSIREFDIEALRAGKHRWIEKTPSHIRHLDEIFEWVPEAKIILIIRDGRDVVKSIKDRTGNLNDGIERWLNDNSMGKKYWNHPNVIRVKYEDFVSNFDLFMSEVLTFLGEEYEESVKEFHKRPKKWYSSDIKKPESAFGNSHNQLRNWQINQPIFDGRGRWKDMSAEELGLVEKELGPMLVELNYPVSVVEEG